MMPTLRVERRRMAIATLLVRLPNPTVRRVHEALNRSQAHGVVSHSTVHRDMQIVRGKFQEVATETGPDLYVRYVADSENIRQELWRLFGATPPPTEGMKLAILNNLLGLHGQRLRMGQSLGIVVKAPERTVLELETGEALKAWLAAITRYMNPDAVEELGRAMDALEKEQPEVAGALSALITQ